MFPDLQTPYFVTFGQKFSDLLLQPTVNLESTKMDFRHPLSPTRVTEQDIL